MLRYLIGLTVSSSSRMVPTLITPESFPDLMTTVPMLPTSWTWESLSVGGADARAFAYMSCRTQNGEPPMVIWSASIYSPRETSAGDLQLYLKDWHLVNLRLSILPSQKISPYHLSLTIRENKLSLCEDEHLEFFRYRTKAMQGAVIEGALFERRMPKNAHNMSVPYHHARNPFHFGPNQKIVNQTYHF
jgi:hypothetical protein